MSKTKVVINFKASFYDQLVELTTKYPKSYFNTLQNSIDVNILKLKHWIVLQTPLLNDLIYRWSTKCYWILNHLTDFPKCSVCNNPMIKKNVISLRLGYNKACSDKCNGASPERLQKVKKTKLKVYGNENYTNTLKRSRTISELVELNPNYWKERSLKSKLTNIKNGHSPGWNNPEKRHLTNIDLHGDPYWNNPEQNAKTCLERYGVRNVFQTEWCKDKIKQTNLLNLGVEWPMQSEECKKKSQDTKTLLYDDPFWTNRDKAKETNLERYGYTCALCNLDIRAKALSTNIENYGVEWPMQNRDFYLQYVDNLLSTKGVSNVFLLDEVKTKCRETWQENYGVDHPMKCHDVASRALSAAEATCLRKFGTLYYWQSDDWNIYCNLKYGGNSPTCDPNVQSKLFHRYSYDNLNFDSSIELAVYIFLMDKHIKFEYHSLKYFIYEFNGKLHKYYPDFYFTTINRFIEIKGDHFFKEDGTMFCPYRYNSWSEDQYANECRKYEAKRQCMIRNNVTIYKESSNFVLNALKYVKNNYSSNYLQEFRT